MYGGNMHHLPASLPGLTLLLALSVASPALAQQPSPGGQGPVEIESDHAELQQQSGVSRYRGDVRVTRDGTVIEGEELVITPEDDGEYLHFSMQGEPATYQEQRPDQAPVSARARHMQYSEVDDILHLEGAARVTRGRDVLEGEQIRYERGTGRIRASGGETPEGRVRILINPDDQEQTDE